MSENVRGRKRRSSWFSPVNSRIYLFVTSALVLLVILYKIWPLPFRYVSKHALLPSVNVLAIMGQKIISPVKLIKNISELDGKNKDLEKENMQLKSSLAIKDDTSKNCSLYTKELEKDSVYKNSIISRVIGRTPGGLNSTLLLNKGSADGVKEGSPVLFSGYFVGKVQKAEENKSEVTLIFSHNSLVPVVMTKNNDGGLLQGGLEGLTITDIPINSKAEPGDNVLTSGLGGDLPSGLIVGKVGVHLGLQGDLFQKVKVESPVNPYQINFVTVLTK